MGSGQKCEVFIEYEAEVSSRVCGVKRGVVDFTKLFTKTTEQKFSVSKVQRKTICSRHPGGNSI